MTLAASTLARACVVYTPPHRQAICIEPYTGLPNPFEAHAHGWEPALQVLAPGGTAELQLEIRVESWHPQEL